MFKNYLTIAIRNLLKHKLYSAINIVGLSIGIACVILITLFVQNELSFNTQHPHSDRLYRILREFRSEDGLKTYDWRVSGAVGPALIRDFPEVEAAIRTMPRTVWIQHKEKTLNRIFCLADSNFLDVLHFPMVRGDKSALLQPNSVLITQSTARDFFGDEDPIGKVLSVEGSYIAGEYTVSGILKDLPKNSSLRFDVLSSSVLPTFIGFWDAWLPRHNWRGITVYARLKENASLENLSDKIPAMVERYMGPEIAERNTYLLQPMREVYLHSKHDYGLQEVLTIEGELRYGNITHVYAASATAIFILIIACINFINLTTARSSNRAREVGLRKVVGAQRNQLAFQFLGESLILSFLSLIVSLCVVFLFLPSFNDYTGKYLALDITGQMILSLIGLTLLVGLLAGGYPSLFLSRFRPVEVLKGALSTGARGGLLRKILVVSQFATSVALIVITLVMSDQVSFIQNKNLGFDKDQVIETRLLWEYRNSRLNTDTLWVRYNTVKDAFLQHPNITAATVSRFPHGRGAPQAVFNAYEEGKGELRMRMNEVDEDFIEFFNIEIVAGRKFSEDAAARFAQESYAPRDQPDQWKVPGKTEYMLSETAVKALGWQDPIGKPFSVRNLRPGYVIGVFKDFHTRTLHEPLEPTVLYCNNWVPKNIFLKVRPYDLESTIAHMEKVWKHFLPIRPFSYSFLDDNLNRRYEQEQQLNRSIGVFATLAIFIACLGLIGLVSFLADQRKREVGIRKVMGASAGNVMGLFLKDSIRLVLLSCILAWPIAYWAVNQWLQGFAYRIDISMIPFLIGGISMVALTIIAEAYQVIKAAQTNPVDVLRNE